jgi:Flp pilus assembly protein TadG
MFAKRTNGRAVPARSGAAAVEFALVAPLLFTLMFGMWEVGRIVEVQNVTWNSSREAARDASLGENNLLTVANNLQTYLQAAEPTAFGAGHSTSMISPVVTLPANTYGYTCWDNTANRELFTVMYADVTNTAITDPTGMAQLDRFTINVQVPYASVGFIPVNKITGVTRLTVEMQWVAMVDAPFQLAPSLPAQ